MYWANPDGNKVKTGLKLVLKLPEETVLGEPNDLQKSL